MFSQSVKPVLVVPAAVILAGLAGALAEVIWIAAYCSIMPLTGNEVLQQITASVFPSAGGAAWAPALGLIMHFALGIAVAYGFAILVWQPVARRMGSGATWCTALLALSSIWAINFFVLLPTINPAFAGLMPYSVTFASKGLFGAAMAATLNARNVSRTVNGAAVALG